MGRVTITRRLWIGLLGSLAVIAVAGCIVTTILIVHHQQQQAAVARANSVHQQLMSMAHSIELKQGYSTLSADKQQDFLIKQGEALGLDMDTERPTPDLLRAKCVERVNYDVLDMATRINQEYGDQAKQFYPMLDYAESSSQAACYANYDPTGKQIIPPVMKHP